MKKENSWMVTHTGKQFFPYDPTVDQIDAVDIAHSLSLNVRFNGHCKWLYTVAQHSINCAKVAEALGYDVELQLHLLLHDASEAYISDLPRPFKVYLDFYKEIEDKVQETILKKFGLNTPDEHQYRVIKLIDNELLCWEGKYLTHDVDNWTSRYKSITEFVPDYEMFMYRNPLEVEMEFLHMLEILKMKLESNKNSLY